MGEPTVWRRASGHLRGIGEWRATSKTLASPRQTPPVREAARRWWVLGLLASYFAPEVTRCASGWLEPVEMIDEFKWMVDQLHQHDIEVIIGGANHIGEGGLCGPSCSSPT